MNGLSDYRNPWIEYITPDMRAKYPEGVSILIRILEYHWRHVTNTSDDMEYRYAQKVFFAYTGGGYSSPIPGIEIVRYLEKTFKQGERIEIEVDGEFLSGDELKSYVKSHPSKIFKAGSRADQCDGWSYHCVIDNNNKFNSEVGF